MESQSSVKGSTDCARCIANKVCIKHGHGDTDYVHCYAPMSIVKANRLVP